MVPVHGQVERTVTEQVLLPTNRLERQWPPNTEGPLLTEAHCETIREPRRRVPRSGRSYPLGDLIV
jgi:hypothetical protein